MQGSSVNLHNKHSLTHFLNLILKISGDALLIVFPQNDCPMLSSMASNSKCPNSGCKSRETKSLYFISPLAEKENTEHFDFGRRTQVFKRPELSIPV